jgi:HAD superfamily hydrolase (TIGR01549 family)
MYATWFLKMKIQEIIFDFDGVLVDSVNVKADAFYQLYAEFGDSIAKQVKNHHLEHGGVTRSEKIAYYHKAYLNQLLSGDDLQLWCQRFSNIVVESVINAQWIPGSLDFLHENSEIYTFHIASATPEDELLYIVKQRSMDHFFDIIQGAPTSKADNVARIIACSGRDPNECVMIGDSVTDYEAAMKNNISFVGVAKSRAHFPTGDLTIIPDLSLLSSLLENYND